MITLRRLAGILSVLVLGLSVSVAQPPADQPPAAPDQGAPGAQVQDQQGGGRGGRDRGMRMDPAQMQQRRVERMKEQLNVTDDEWKAVEPALTKVVKAQSEMMAGRMGGMGRMGGGGRGGRGPDGQGGPGMGQPQQMPEQQALQTAIDDENSKTEDIKAKLDAYKAAMAKKESELKDARAKLRELLNVRQEARLVLMGILD